MLYFLLLAYHSYLSNLYIYMANGCVFYIRKILKNDIELVQTFKNQIIFLECYTR